MQTSQDTTHLSVLASTNSAKSASKHGPYAPKERFGSFSFQNKENTCTNAGLTFQFNGGTQMLGSCGDTKRNHNNSKASETAPLETPQRPLGFVTTSSGATRRCFILGTRTTLERQTANHSGSVSSPQALQVACQSVVKHDQQEKMNTSATPNSASECASSNAPTSLQEPAIVPQSMSDGVLATRMQHLNIMTSQTQSQLSAQQSSLPKSKRKDISPFKAPNPSTTYLKYIPSSTQQVMPVATIISSSQQPFLEVGSGARTTLNQSRGIMLKGSSQANEVSPVSSIPVVQPHENVPAPPPKKSFSQRLRENNNDNHTHNDRPATAIHTTDVDIHQDQKNKEGSKPEVLGRTANHNTELRQQPQPATGGDAEEEIVNSLFIHFIQTCSQPKEESTTNSRTSNDTNVTKRISTKQPIEIESANTPIASSSNLSEAQQGTKGGPLSGMIFSLLGRNFTAPRNQLKQIIMDHGGEVSEKITHKVTHLLCSVSGDSGEEESVVCASAKYQRAKELGLPVVTEAWLKTALQKRIL